MIIIIIIIVIIVIVVIINRRNEGVRERKEAKWNTIVRRRKRKLFFLSPFPVHIFHDCCFGNRREIYDASPSPSTYSIVQNQFKSFVQLLTIDNVPRGRSSRSPFTVNINIQILLFLSAFFFLAFVYIYIGNNCKYNCVINIRAFVRGSNAVVVNKKSHELHYTPIPPPWDSSDVALCCVLCILRVCVHESLYVPLYFHLYCIVSDTIGARNRKKSGEKQKTEGKR